ncbi:MAG TPA: hypothetical protein VIL74_15610 [Pyrinomonadaceae bacterium]|jgi:hypothetical protein
MRKFIVDLFSNRFGIVLAALNVSYFANLFEKGNLHSFGEQIFYSANMPCFLFSYLAGTFLQNLFHKIEIISTVRFHLLFVFFSFFMILQWLFIAWASKALAEKIQKSKAS